MPVVYHSLVALQVQDRRVPTVLTADVRHISRISYCVWNSTQYEIRDTNVGGQKRNRSDQSVQIPHRLDEPLLGRERRVLMLHRQHAVVADLAQRADELAPADAAVAWQRVAPPAVAAVADPRQLC